jgi:hypothetical protein
LTAILPEHLLPEGGGDEIPSADYKVLERRFKGFLGLCYFKDSIESGLQRARTLFPPAHEKSIAGANEKTFTLAKEREETGERWKRALEKSGNEVIMQNEIPMPKRGFFPTAFILAVHFSRMKKIAHAMLRAFKELKLVDRRAKVMIEKDGANKTVNVGIHRCSKQEKSMFHQAMGEICGMIDAPKYIIVKKRGSGKLDYRMSYAVPEIFANRKEIAEVFRVRMSKRVTEFELLFTRSADGRQHLGTAKRKARVNKHFVELAAKMKMKVK